MREKKFHDATNCVGRNSTTAVVFLCLCERNLMYASLSKPSSREEKTLFSFHSYVMGDKQNATPA